MVWGCWYTIFCMDLAQLHSDATLNARLFWYSRFSSLRQYSDFNYWWFAPLAIWELQENFSADLPGWSNRWNCWVCYDSGFKKAVFVGKKGATTSHLRGLLAGSLLIPEKLFFEVGPTLSQLIRYSSILFGTLIITRTSFTLFIFHSSHSRWKK